MRSLADGFENSIRGAVKGFRETGLSQETVLGRLTRIRADLASQWAKECEDMMSATSMATAIFHANEDAAIRLAVALRQIIQDDE